jgi:iron complex transport system ATP-binding protein
MTPALQTHELAVGYRGRPAILSNIDITVEPGEMVALLGVNGIGKSTLMRTLARMQPALAGSVHIMGHDITHMSKYDLARNVAVVLTERVAIGAMSACQLVELGRYPHVNWSGRLSDTDRDIVRDAIAAVGGQHLAHRDIAELSDGERQRIMIARALAQRPAVLLLDEPAAFLDVSARVEMIAMLRQLARERHVAIILSSHDLELSLRTADTIWLIAGNGQMHIGAPEDLLADGSVAAAFSGPNILFSADERTFKLRRHPHGKAFVTGANAQLAQAALEREGFAMASSPEEAQFVVTMDVQGWQTPDGRGKTFAELARFARQKLAAPHQPEHQS